MFDSRTVKSRASRLHERNLRLVYPDLFILSFLTLQQLPMKGETVSLQQKNFEILSINFYKAKNNTSEIKITQYISTTRATLSGIYIQYFRKCSGLPAELIIFHCLLRFYLCNWINHIYQ